MAFHLLAFTELQAVSATVPIQLNGVFDGYATFLSDNNYTLPRNVRLLAGYAQGPTITRANINTPSAREVGFPELQPVAVGAAPLSLFPIPSFRGYGIEIPQNGEVQFQTTNAAGAAEQQFGGLWVGDGLQNIPVGQITSLHFTATNTGGNLIWGASALVPDATLPYGKYAVVGMDVLGANLVFARLVFPSNTMKPGILARRTSAILPDQMFRNGNFGEFGRFDSTAIPGLEILGSAAGTTQDVWLDLIKVG